MYWFIANKAVNKLACISLLNYPKIQQNVKQKYIVLKDHLTLLLFL